MRLFKIIGVLTLSALFAVSCSKEAGTTNGSQEVGCPEEMILDIKFPGQTKPSHMAIDNQRKKVTLDFAEGVVPSHVELNLILEEGVTMKNPSENPFVLDLTKTCPIVLAYAGKDYRYLVIANYGDNSDENVMMDGPVSDMALMYYGGSHRIGLSDWTPEQLRSNVVYEDRNGKEHWLFDSFLFLETSDGGGHYFESGFMIRAILSRTKRVRTRVTGQRFLISILRPTDQLPVLIKRSVMPFKECQFRFIKEESSFSFRSRSIGRRTGVRFQARQ